MRIAAQQGRPGGHLGKRSPPKAADWAPGLAGYPFRDILAKGEAGANQASQANPEDFPLVHTSKVAGTVPKRTCHSPLTAPHYATTVTTRTCTCQARPRIRPSAYVSVISLVSFSLSLSVLHMQSQ